LDGIAPGKKEDAMVSGVFNLIDGSLIQELRFSTISNNLANLGTTAFKRDVIAFDQMLSMRYLSQTDFSPGPVTYTGNDLDMALPSKGFFKIRTPQGIRYTRDGTFSLDREGTLVTRQGDSVLGENGPIRISGRNVTVGKDGTVRVDRKPAGRILVVTVDQSEFLKKEGGSYYRYQGPEGGVRPVSNPVVKHRYLERSNVNPTAEMIRMVDAFRAFESAQKALQTIDEMTRKMIDDSNMG